jgi:peptide/nickel transport system ATP-binding protein
MAERRIMIKPPLLELRQLNKVYGLGRASLLSQKRELHALRNISLSVAEGEVVGLVGESGSGKSTLGRIAAGLENPSSGQVFFDGEPVAGSTARNGRRRLLAVQMIFQNAIASLNPRQRVRDILEEPIRVHGTSARDPRDVVDELIERVGINAALVDRYPHQMSGGQCQRVGIARALTVTPRLIVCDEPVSALDVSIQAQILNLFADLQEFSGYTYLFISHDLNVVEMLSDRVAIMYLGRIVEIGPTKSIYSSPAHPYTQALLEAAPKVGRRRETVPVLGGEMPSPISPPGGCSFHLRCPAAMSICKELEPPEANVGRSHWVACHLHQPPAALTPQRSVPTGYSNKAESSSC